MRALQMGLVLFGTTTFVGCTVGFECECTCQDPNTGVNSVMYVDACADDSVEASEFANAVPCPGNDINIGGSTCLPDGVCFLDPGFDRPIAPIPDFTVPAKR